MLLLLACTHGPPPPTTLRLGADTVIAQGDGLELHQFQWQTEQGTGRAWAARLNRESRLEVVPSATVQPLAALVGGQLATRAAINGGFYREGPMGLVVSAGVEQHPRTPDGGSGIVVYNPMPITILHRDAYATGAQQALQSVDRLVDGGHSLVAPRAEAHRDARAAIVCAADAVWLVTAFADASIQYDPTGIQLVDTIGQGLTLSEFADLLIGATRAQQALNLDGAVSTQMMVSLPAGRWELRGERGTINALVLRNP